MGARSEERVVTGAVGLRGAAEGAELGVVAAMCASADGCRWAVASRAPDGGAREDEVDARGADGWLASARAGRLTPVSASAELGGARALVALARVGDELLFAAAGQTREAAQEAARRVQEAAGTPPERG